MRGGYVVLDLTTFGALQYDEPISIDKEYFERVVYAYEHNKPLLVIANIVGYEKFCAYMNYNSVGENSMSLIGSRSYDDGVPTKLDIDRNSVTLYE